ncbi:mitochondrial import inner membrane translocase subunit Tim13-like [Orbicella faveolata]|uniref:mitochondrial import inner membrane translocase subunit Tim13-like n=1 Tax=Orbicella faveolata TaxID=48498 RepID=UPI0009E41067|nr:mitochondrial import inner membrane translocase subunit Tim13-like [Orbicella faveolata]
MSDFGFSSPSSSSSSGGMNGAQRAELMEQVQSQLLVATLQEMLAKMSDKCFKKCVNKPGPQLDNSEQKCISMCMDRFMDAWNTVSKTTKSRLQREHSPGGSFS